MVIFNFYTLLTGIAAINLIFISIYCFLPKQSGNKLQAALLSMFCVLLSLNILYDILTFNRVFGYYLKYLDEFSLLLAFPALYFYVLLRTDSSLTFKRSFLLHILPAVVFIILWVFPSNSFLTWNRNPLMNFVYANYNYSQFLFYILSILLFIWKKDNVAKELNSPADNQNISWMKQLLAFMTILFLAWFMDNAGFINGNLMAIPLLLFSYWLGYHTIHQKNHYNHSSESKLDVIIPGQIRYKNSKLTEQSKKSYASQIEELMSLEKPYLNNELTLTLMADRLDLKPIHLSQVLNEEFEENFYAFINRYRIMESQKLLKDQGYQHYSIQAIAFEAGFNSISTFNKAFKEIVGISPSIYQKQ